MCKCLLLVTTVFQKNVPVLCSLASKLHEDRQLHVHNHDSKKFCFLAFEDEIEMKRRIVIQTVFLLPLPLGVVYTVYSVLVGSGIDPACSGSHFHQIVMGEKDRDGQKKQYG